MSLHSAKGMCLLYVMYFIQYFVMRKLKPLVNGLAGLKSFPHQIPDSTVVSIQACHAWDPGSIPGRGDYFLFFFLKLMF